MIHKFIGHSDILMSVGFEFNNKIVSGSWNADVIVWNEHYGTEKKYIKDHE